MSNPKHELAKVVMDAVVAGSKLGASDRDALMREMALARERAERRPATTDRAAAERR